MTTLVPLWLAVATVPVPLWLIFGGCILVGVALMTGGWIAFMMYISSRENRNVPDKVER